MSETAPATNASNVQPELLDAYYLQGAYQENYQARKDAEDVADHTAKEAVSARGKLSETLGAAGVETHIGIDLAQTAREVGMVALADEIEGKREAGLAAQADLRHASAYEKASLWDAREHYQANQQAYVEAAVNDAAAKGIEINIGGQAGQS